MMMKHLALVAVFAATLSGCAQQAADPAPLPAPPPAATAQAGAAQQPGATAGRGQGRGGGGGGFQGVMDSVRARQLYVSRDPKDLAGCGNNCERDIAVKRATDSTYAARSQGVMEFRKVTYKSRVDGLEIPAYVF